MQGSETLYTYCEQLILYYLPFMDLEDVSGIVTMIKVYIIYHVQALKALNI